VARERVEELMSCLEERDRTMLVLKEVQDFRWNEIAELMEINANTVKVRLFRARQGLRSGRDADGEPARRRSDQAQENRNRKKTR